MLNRDISKRRQKKTQKYVLRMIFAAALIVMVYAAASLWIWTDVSTYTLSRRLNAGVYNLVEWSRIERDLADRKQQQTARRNKETKQEGEEADNTETATQKQT